MRFDPWTFGLQTVNFLVLLWLLRRFLYRPVMAAIAARQAATEKLTSDVEAQRRTLDSERRRLADQQEALAAQRTEALAAAQEAADAERRTLLQKAHAEAEAVRADARKGFERERTEIVSSVGHDAARLAVSVTRRLLADLPAAAVQEPMLDLVCRDVAALPADTKSHIAERLAASGGAAKVVTAAPLTPQAAERFAARLTEALGAPAAPAFEVDPALIAGAEIHFPFTILRRSLAQNLQRMEAELVDDDRPTTIA